jgi:hypothetical protein
METGQWKRLKALYQTAAELDPEERPAYLDQACRDNPALRKEVEGLLASESSLGEFLEPPAP